MEQKVNLKILSANQHSYNKFNILWTYYRNNQILPRIIYTHSMCDVWYLLNHSSSSLVKSVKLVLWFERTSEKNSATKDKHTDQESWNLHRCWYQVNAMSSFSKLNNYIYVNLFNTNIPYCNNLDKFIGKNYSIISTNVFGMMEGGGGGQKVWFLEPRGVILDYWRACSLSPLIVEHDTIKSLQLQERYLTPRKCKISKIISREKWK